MSKSTMPSVGNEPKRFKSEDSNDSMDNAERCFVCDELIFDKKYPIANCLTNTTKSRLIEVLGRLVSEKYVVVVSNVDKICRTCANLVNNLDKLEYDIMNTKQTLLSHIEKKYSLHDDDLYQKATPKKVILGNAQNFKNSLEPKTPLPEKTTTFKGSAVMPNIISTGPKVSTSKTTPSVKSVSTNVWMQCNQCQYTTNQRPVMLEHLRQHKTKQQDVTSDQLATDDEQESMSGGLESSAISGVLDVAGDSATDEESPRIIASSSTSMPMIG